MAVDSNFSSLFHNLKLEDPYLPPKPWESIPSESGLPHSHPSDSNPSDSLYDPSTVSEVNLVRLAINALQGVEASLYTIEKLSESFCTNSADRTCHGIPSLWYRSSSTNALGKILKSIGRSGFIAFLIRRFVDYFRGNVGEIGSEGELNTCRSGSLVNQAFAVAVEKVLEGFICGLDTLYASVQLRRSPNGLDTSVGNSGMGFLTSVAHSEITFMEVYLHTRELRTQIEAIGNICSFENVARAFSTSSLEDLTDKAVKSFHTFPKGADLLSYLYTQLRDSDPAHRAVLKYLFTRSCEPYYGFIKSWIYEAKIDDPYKEFIVEYDYSPTYSHGGHNFCNTAWLSSIRVREGVSIPCFLENFSRPLIRAGQQLQVLIRLLELCNCIRAGAQAYEDILPCWGGSLSTSVSTPLTFSTRKVEELVLMRENMYRHMQEKLLLLVARLDNGYRPISSNLMPCDSREAATTPLSCSMDKSAINVIDDNKYLDRVLGSHRSETSSAVDDISYQVDPFESSSDCSSWESSEEQNDNEKAIKTNDSVVKSEIRSSSASGYFKTISNANTLLDPSQCQKQSTLECVSCTNIEAIDPIEKNGDHPEETNGSHPSGHFRSVNATWCRFSENRYDDDYNHVHSWPLGGLYKNPFSNDRGLSCDSKSLFINSNLQAPDISEEVLVGKVSMLGEQSISDDSFPHQTREDLDFRNHTLSTLHIATSWKLKYNCKVFTMNPMLTKNVWCHTIDTSRDRSSVDYKQSCLSYFDFSSVEDPRMVFSGKLVAGPERGFQSHFHLLSDCAVPSIKAANKCYVEEKPDQPHTHVDHIVNSKEENSLTSTSGGGRWESSLSYLNKRVVHSGGDDKESSASGFDVPLDVIIDKSILQDIVLQYEYISNFTIKLLEDGFDLQAHLLALRRYHFMEFADWADLFIMSLWRHKYRVTEASEKISEIQGFLDLAVQRSSCEGDPYKERLYLHMKDLEKFPISVPATGVHAFDFIALGYKVDWPVSIILTSSALNIYSDIFSFLIHVKLAVFSLTDVWCTVKDLVSLISRNHHSGLNEKDKNCVNILMRMRLQINHFVSTLQQYVQSQLSHVSWCKFLHSLKHQVKDMFDLESVHMAYLADSLHICFLSDETRQIAGIIDNILQCALDFRSCFTTGSWDVGNGSSDSSKVLGRLNLYQVRNIKSTFEKNLKELYHCYLKSPKHGEFSLCRFWGYLNYNDYYSGVINNGPRHYA
ncbi:hypothetical protein ACHQM5_019600 [Ranunculus cassubicifolius]